jgi:hypothetical protein
MTQPVISNSYVGDGSTVLYSFTFPYIETTDLRVSLDAVETTSYILANATTIQLTTAPATGVAIKIFRVTADNDLKSVFFPGSAVRARDLNDNFTQSLYVVQEARSVSDTAKTQSAAAEASALSANTNATAAAASAATATAQAAAAATGVATAAASATQASTDAAAAQASATAAAASSVTAASEASQATTDSATAISTAQGAVTTANASSTLATTADGNATTSLNRVNTYLHDGTNPVGDGVGSNPQGLAYAINTANTSASSAASAVSTASNATSTANTASTTASSALSIANAASAAVSQAVLFTLVANVAAIPGSPSNNDYIEVGDSTGIQSFTPLSSIPSGFVGASGLTARIRYDSSTSSWVFMSYFANDPEDRYFTKTAGNTNTTNITTKMPLAGGTFTGAVSFDDNVIVKGDGTNGSGELTLNCENNSHGIKIKGPPHSAAASYTLTLPNDTGSNGQALTTDGNGALSFADIASSIITQTDFAYTPSSNTATLTTLVSAAAGISAGEYYVGTDQGVASIWFSNNDTQVKDALNTLSVGDSVTITYDTFYNGYGQPGTVLNTTISQLPTADPGSPGNNNLQVMFAANWNLAAPTSGNVVIYSAAMSNGTEPLANNQVLRYKTATQKWTVDNAEVIAICDGGNFANGSSLVQTSTTFDGGSF